MDISGHYLITLSELVKLYNIAPDCVCCHNCTSRESDCDRVRKDAVDYCQFCREFTPDWELIKAEKS